MILSLGILLLLLATCGAAPSVDHSVFEKGVLVSDSEVTGLFATQKLQVCSKAVLLLEFFSVTCCFVSVSNGRWFWITFFLGRGVPL